jgi:hypothetical protein
VRHVALIAGLEALAVNLLATFELLFGAGAIGGPQQCMNLASTLRARSKSATARLLLSVVSWDNSLRP